MAIKEGLNIPASSVEQYIRDKSPQYFNVYDQIKLGYDIGMEQAALAGQTATEKIEYDVSKAIGEAYASAFGQKESIKASNIGSGQKSMLTNITDDALNQAYEQYIANYQQNKQSIDRTLYDAQETYNENLSALNKQVTTDINTLTDYANRFTSTMPEYLQYLYSERPELFIGGTDEEGNPILADDFFKQYVNPETNELYSWDTIQYGILDELTGDFTLPGLLDPKRMDFSSIRGKEFFDKLTNVRYGDDTTNNSYFKWLAENDEELYNYLNTVSAFNQGTNLEYLYEMITGDVEDYVYSPYERMKALMDTEIRDIINNFSTELNNIELTKRDDVYTVSNKLYDTFEKLGIDIKKIEKEQNVNLEEALLKYYDSEYKDKREVITGLETILKDSITELGGDVGRAGGMTSAVENTLLDNFIKDNTERLVNMDFKDAIKEIISFVGTVVSDRQKELGNEKFTLEERKPNEIVSFRNINTWTPAFDYNERYGRPLKKGTDIPVYVQSRDGSINETFLFNIQNEASEKVSSKLEKYKFTNERKGLVEYNGRYYISDSKTGKWFEVVQDKQARTDKYSNEDYFKYLQTIK